MLFLQKNKVKTVQNQDKNLETNKLQFKNKTIHTKLLKYGFSILLIVLTLLGVTLATLIQSDDESNDEVSAKTSQEITLLTDNQEDLEKQVEEYLSESEQDTTVTNPNLLKNLAVSTSNKLEDNTLFVPGEFVFTSDTLTEDKFDQIEGLGLEVEKLA